MLPVRQSAYYLCVYVCQSVCISVVLQISTAQGLPSPVFMNLAARHSVGFP